LAERVFWHVGLPKTGTTYLQSVLWANRQRLAEQGVLLPGSSARQQMQASVVVREHPGLAKRSAEVRESWDRIRAEIAAHDGTAIVSHEFFGAATAEQAARGIAQLAPAEVHVVVTARDLLSVVTSYWQEFIKHGFDAALDEFPDVGRSYDEWSWAALDLKSVLQRWSPTLDPTRVHVVVLPEPGAPRRALVDEFAGVVGFDASEFDTDQAQENSSLGVVEAELLRRLTPSLTGFTSARDRGVWIRSYLAQNKLVPRGGDRFLPSPERVEELRQKATDIVGYLTASDFDVVGDLDRLRVPDELPVLRHPGSVTEAELWSAAAELFAIVLGDVRIFREHNTAMRKAGISSTHLGPGAGAEAAGSVATADHG
jgi:hypothetical protein